MPHKMVRGFWYQFMRTHAICALLCWTAILSVKVCDVLELEYCVRHNICQNVYDLGFKTLFRTVRAAPKLFHNKHLMTGPEGNSEFCFPRNSLFPKTKSRETLRFEGNKVHCSPSDQLLSDLLYSKTKQKQNLKTALRFQPSRATAVNISRVTVNCFPFDVIVFAMLPAHGILRETVSLLDVMWPWTSQWMGGL